MKSKLESARRGFASSSSGVIWLAFLGIFIICGVLILATGGDNLFALDSIRDMFQRSVGLGIVAAGQTVVILGASLDLSVGYLISYSSLIAADVMKGDAGNMFIGILAVLGVGLAVGLGNGLIITKLRVNPFIATLGMALILRTMIQKDYTRVLPGIPSELNTTLGSPGGWIGPISMGIILMLAVVAAVWFILRYTRLGHRLYAVGGNPEVAKYSGVRTDRVLIAAHIICSLCAVLAGLYLAARLGAGSPVVGTDRGYDLESIAAVVIGGTALLGGRGGVLGTLAGVLILSVLDKFFNEIGLVNNFAREVMRGSIIIIAVAIYSLQYHRRLAASAVGGLPPSAGDDDIGQDYPAPVVTKQAAPESR